MSYIISNKKLKEFSYIFEDFYIINTSQHNQVYVNSKEFFLLEGFVYDLILDRKLDLIEIAGLLQQYCHDKEVFPENITGQYNIVYLNENKVHLVSDFVGMKPLYYHFGKSIIVSNNIYKFLKLDFEIDHIGFFQSIVGNLYIPLNSRTLIKDVLILRNGEHISYDVANNLCEATIDKMNMQNLKISHKDVDNFICLLQDNASLYQKSFDKILLPISAGVDSRITLSSFKNIGSNFNTLSYGEHDYIDNKIGKKIAEFVGVSHLNISFKNHLFPTTDEFDALIENGGDYFVSSWFSVISDIKSKERYSDSVVLLGDVLDTLRAKNLKSFRTRKERVKYQLKNIIGLELELEPLSLEKYVANHLKYYESKINNFRISYPFIFNQFNFDEKEFLEKTKLDIYDFVEFINNKFCPKNQANLEEAFYVCTWGARTMSKQINIFKGSFESYVMMASRHLVKHNLKFSPLERFEDRLTHKLLRSEGFDMYSHFPTAQIPFVSYKSNIYLKYMVWALRSSLDQILIKLGRGRLVKHIEWAQYYQNENNKILLEKLLFEIDGNLKKIPIDIFNSRASGESWPLSEVDINVFSILFKLKYLK